MNTIFLAGTAFTCVTGVAAEPFRLPVPMVWQVNYDTLSRRQYIKDIDYLREHTRADILQLAPVEGVMPEDTDQFHAPVKELVEYARSRGFRVILRTSPKTKGFFSVGAYSGKVGVPVTGPLPCVLEDQSKAQALTVDVEGTFDADGFVALESTAKWNRDKIMSLYARPLRAWAFEPVGSDSYRNGSLEDVTARLRIVYRDNRTVKVELDLGPAYAGKRAFLFALVSRGILDGKSVKFDFTVDGARYQGSHTGMLAVRGGKVSVATDGWKMDVLPANGK